MKWWKLPASEATLNDVIIEGNRADDNNGAIGNSGTLNLNEGTIITNNTARNQSAIENLDIGTVNIHAGVHIFDNHDEQQQGRSVHSGGIMNMDFSWEQRARSYRAQIFLFKLCSVDSWFS